MPKKRILYLDVVKIVAMWLVCVGHVYTFVDTGSDTLRDWIYSFHMPLFMMLSGFFSFHAFDKSFKEFIVEKSKQLLLPSITIPTVCLIMLWAFGNKIDTLVVEDQYIGGMWFLKTLFACYLTLYVLKLLPLLDGWLCLLSILFAVIIPQGSILQYNWMLMFFWTGYFLRKYYDRYERHLILITICSLLFFLILGLHKEPNPISLSFVIANPTSLLFSYFTALSGSLAVVGGVEVLIRNYHGKIIHKLGEMGSYTLGIYALQHLLFYGFLSQIFSIKIYGEGSVVMDYLGEPIIGLFCVFICYGFVKWLRKYKLINLLFFGGQYKY